MRPITVTEIEQYLEEHAHFWTAATLASERARLNALGESALNMEPAQLALELTCRGLRPYTQKTTFLRLAAFHTWRQGGDSEHAFSAYIAKAKRRFRHAYKRVPLALTYAEAYKALMTAPEMTPQVRAACLYLLQTGLRIHELYKVQEVAPGIFAVEGKGGKSRPVALPPPSILPSPHQIRRQLAGIGLKPHSLRKLMATQLLKKKLPIHDVCAVMGWAQLQTAQCYIQQSSIQALLAQTKEALSDVH